MNWNKWVRQSHRWLSMVFTVAVIINTVAVVRGAYTNQMGFLAVVPLFLLLFTGLYLFVLPYVRQNGDPRHSRL
jgi:heme A synthase